MSDGIHSHRSKSGGDGWRTGVIESNIFYSCERKKKAGRDAASGNEPSEAPPAAAPAPPPAAAPKPAALAAARAEAVLWAAIAGGRLSALEAALAVASREVWEGGVGAEARAQCNRLLEM